MKMPFPNDSLSKARQPERPRALLVEDEQPIRDVLVPWLLEDGFDCREAADGRAAMQLLATGLRIDLVLSNMLLPLVDGMTLLSQMKQGYPRIPFAVVTAVSDSDIRNEAMQKGADGYLLKPFSREEFVAFIHRVMGETERPDYFVECPSKEAAILRQLKGNFRRELVAKSIEVDGLSSVSPAWTTHDISEGLKEALTETGGPQARGGEDLPNLVQNQIEIARVTLADSVHGEVTSLRAIRESAHSSISLSMVDEYGTEFQLRTNSVLAPLSAADVLLTFRDAEPNPTSTPCRMRFSSFFYPDLNALAFEMGMKVTTPSDQYLTS